MRSDAGAATAAEVEELKHRIDGQIDPFASEAAGAGAGAREAELLSASPVRSGDAPAASESIMAAVREVEIAERARDELAVAVTQAEQTETRAARAVAEAAQAVIIAHGLEVAAQIAEAEAELLEKRRRLWGIDKIWVNGGALKLPDRIVVGLAGMILHGGDTWPAAHKRLLDDPEAELP